MNIKKLFVVFCHFLGRFNSCSNIWRIKIQWIYQEAWDHYRFVNGKVSTGSVLRDQEHSEVSPDSRKHRCNCAALTQHLHCANDGCWWGKDAGEWWWGCGGVSSWWKEMQVSWILYELLGAWEPCFSSQYLQGLAQQVFNKSSLESEWRANE